MSFLIDPALLYAGGSAYAQRAPERSGAPPTRALGALVVGVFYVVSGSLYFERAWTRPLWRLFRARGGRDFMVNSGLLRLDARDLSWRSHALAVGMFATYPLWWAAGCRRGTRSRTPR